jgi:DNA-binding MarR family transcriptional regulator
MWASGQKDQAEKARAIGYARATTVENIKRMKEKGELL